MYSNAQRIAVLAAAISMGTLAATAQPSVEICQGPELESAAWLLGQWHIEIDEPTESDEKPPHIRTGVSMWDRRVDGCAFVERLYVDEDGEPYSELRLLTYDARADAWTMATVDSHHGNTVLMTGRQVTGAFEFTSSKHHRGRLLLDRVTIRRVHADTLRHRVESSFDLGETWTTLVESQYSRAR